MAFCVSPKIGMSSSKRRLLHMLTPTSIQENSIISTIYNKVGRRSLMNCRRTYSTTASCCAKDTTTDETDNSSLSSSSPSSSSAKSYKSKTGPIKLANILQHASQTSKKLLLNGIKGQRRNDHQYHHHADNKSSSSSHPAHHFVAGGTPCDPAPQPFHLADVGEDSLYTLVLLRHGESEWNALNRKCCGTTSMVLLLSLMCDGITRHQQVHPINM